MLRIYRFVFLPSAARRAAVSLIDASPGTGWKVKGAEENKSTQHSNTSNDEKHIGSDHSTIRKLYSTYKNKCWIMTHCSAKLTTISSKSNSYQESEQAFLLQCQTVIYLDI